MTKKEVEDKRFELMVQVDEAETNQDKTHKSIALLAYTLILADQDFGDFTGLDIEFDEDTNQFTHGENKSNEIQSFQHVNSIWNEFTRSLI